MVELATIIRELLDLLSNDWCMLLVLAVDTKLTICCMDFFFSFWYMNLHVDYPTADVDFIMGMLSVSEQSYF